MLRGRLTVVLLASAAGGLWGQEQLWRQLRDEGQAALDRGDLAGAEKQWGAAETEARNLGTKSPQFLEGHLNLARLYTLEWRFPEATAFLDEVAKLSPAAASDWQTLAIRGRLEKAESNLPLAEKDLDAALTIVTRTLGADHPKTAEVLSALGDVRRERDAFSTAEDNLRRAVGILAETTGLPGLDTVEARLGAARLMFDGGSYSNTQREALADADTAQKAGGLARAALGDCLTTLGEAYAALGQTEFARSSLERALEGNTSVFGPQSLRSIPALTALADLAASTGEAGTASPLLDRADAIFKANPQPDWLPRAQALLVSAKVALAAKRLDAAEMALAQAREIASRKLGEGSLFMAQVLEVRGDLRLESGNADRIDRAEADYRAAMTARERLLPANHPDLARSFADLGRIYQLRGQYVTADDFYKKPLQMLDRVAGNDGFALIPTLQKYENFLRDQGRTSDARGIQERIERLRKER
jgi:tetratricopeptide (TPR) repeat protein